MCHYGLRFKITHQVVLKVLVNRSVATTVLTTPALHARNPWVLSPLSRWLDKLHPFHLGIAGTVQMLLKRFTP